MDNIQDEFNQLIERKSFFDRNFDNTLSNVLEYLKNLSNFDKNSIDYKVLEKDILIFLEYHNINLKLVYDYCNLYNNSFLDKVNNQIENSTYSASVLLQYLIINNKDKECILEYIVKIIRHFENNDLDYLNYIKQKAINEGFYDETLQKIKSSGDKRVVVIASLYYDEELIKEIFENKINMYFYIRMTPTFSDEEKQLFIDKLCTLDKNEFGNIIDNFKRNIDESNDKINKKIYNH